MPFNNQWKVSLTIIEGPDKDKTFDFSEPDNFLIGRDASGTKAHYRLGQKDTYVSRNHFLIEINPPYCFLRDAGSLNGTFIIKKDKQVVNFLQGRQERAWQATADRYIQQYQCASSSKAAEKVEIHNNDIIAIGNTHIQVTTHEEQYENQQNGHFQGLLNCIRCGKSIGREHLGKEAKSLVSADFICKDCLKKARGKKAQKLTVICFACSSDMSSLANADGRAEELKDVALYVCDKCAADTQGVTPIAETSKYKLIKKLGEGGFGVVFLARDKNTGRLAALKITREKIKNEIKLIQRFKREIAIMKELRHPNLIRLYDEGVTEKDNVYFVSEYLTEGSLTDYLHSIKNKRGFEDKSLSWKIPCFVVVSALQGLSYLHKHGYIHRDIKPENILIGTYAKDKTVAKVSDFGLAKNYVLRGGTITQQGDFSGTLFFCPPEQIFDFKNAKPSSDIYSMGVTLYYVITGEFPYNFPTRNECIEMLSKGKKPPDPISIILGDVQPIPVEERRDDLPKELARAINKAIRKDPSRRFESSAAFQKALEDSLQ